MLDVGFSELLLILAAAVVFLRPKDVPVVIRHVAKIANQLRSLSAGVRSQIKEVVDEVNVTTIIDLEGKPQKAYDVAELKALEKPRADV